MSSGGNEKSFASCALEAAHGRASTQSDSATLPRAIKHRAEVYKDFKKNSELTCSLRWLDDHGMNIIRSHEKLNYI